MGWLETREISPPLSSRFMIFALDSMSSSCHFRTANTSTKLPKTFNLQKFDTDSFRTPCSRDRHSRKEYIGLIPSLQMKIIHLQKYQKLRAA